MEDFLIKKKSKIHGKGVFTKKDLQKGKKFYIVPTNKISNKPKRGFAFIGGDKWVNDKKVLNFVNHSCNPNTNLIVSKKNPYLISKKKIKKGEEITCDYNKTEKGGEKIKCNCKSKNCRGYFLRIE